MELTIDIRKPLFEDYLNYYFDRDDVGRFKVSHRQSVGKLLCSMVEYSYRPVEQKGRTRLVVSCVFFLINGTRTLHVHLARESS